MFYFLYSLFEIIAPINISRELTKFNKKPAASDLVKICVSFEGFTAMTMKNVVFWDVTQRDFRRNRYFGERIAPIINVKGISELGKLAVTN
jgi:hypothetical protein